MKKVVIASENPVKVEVAKRAFAAVFPDESFEYIAYKSESNVPEQPMGEETIQGARNRLAYIKTHIPDADYWISQEGGAYTDYNEMYARAWIVVSDTEGFTAEASTASEHLPNGIAELMHSGIELGHATDMFFNQTNTKHGLGAIGYLTDGLITRMDYYLQPAIIALSELKHKDWYRK
jgi:inosine/xanthosine triphosphatase